MSADDMIQQALRDLIPVIVEKMRRDGKVVSGRTAATLRQDGNTIKGASYFDVILNGRAGGGVPRNFRHILLRWAQAKGLTFASESDAQRWAYFTARKIAKFGTKQYRDKQHLTIIDEASDELRRILNEKVNIYIVDNLTRNRYK